MALARKDSWAGALALEDLAKVYETWMRFHGKWEDFADWVAKTFPEARRPSRSALYDSVRAPSEACPNGGCVYRAWVSFRSEAIRAAGEQMAAWAKSADIDDATLVEGLKNLGCNALSTGDQEAGLDLLKDFRDTARLMLEKREHALKAKAQATKDAQLALAREKFEAAEKRLDAAKKTVADESLSDEQRVGKIKELFGIK